MESPWSFNNFSSAPTFNLKWGRQRQLRCVKDPELTHPEFNSDSFRKRRSSSSSSSDDANDGGIEAVKEKLILDFRAEVDKMQSDFLKSPAKDAAAAETETAELRPWNLRTRRAVCKDPNNSPEKITGEVKLASKGVSCDGGGGGSGGERRKFSVSLSKSEIADDFLMMTGGRPARRPKKRSKYVQRQIDAVSPGYWLTEITADMYKVDERPIDGGKK